ncbi:hypothetical protein K439DRAFT_1631568 [Ramaria rubella]|nr:hypothetical protein K439DRAFT_1631568 [Ramaria rubella]
MGLLSLPDEVLEIAFKSLLPPFRSQSLAETYVFTVPVDLLAVRVASRRLHRLATPYAWRRAQLQIASPTAMSYGNCALTFGHPDPVLVSAAKASFRSLVRCRFFCDHPELAAHVRVLLISLEWHADGREHAQDALRAATRAMSGLRTLLVWDADVLAIKDIRQLLQRPLLRAICLMDVDGSVFPAQCDWGARLKMLHIANSVSPARLIAGAAANLECLSIELAKSGPDTVPPVPTLREMPWTTLREVALVDCVHEEDWYCFLDGFERHIRRGLPAVLTELMVGELAGLASSRITQLLCTFSAQPLTRLTLYHVVNIDPRTIARIAQAFPTLLHLTLLSECELAPWPGTLDEYAQELRGLVHLESLTWNNFMLDPSLDAMYLSLNNTMLGTLYSECTHTLVRYVRSLRWIEFFSTTDSIMDTVYVKISPNAGTKGAGPVVVRRSMEAALHTSSWSTKSESFQDI